ncbi:MAG: alpha/beta hydrolase, partial [Pseudomonadota bacterium]
GYNIRYGFVVPESPKAVIVCLPGLSEFVEKYFETARNFLERDIGFFVLDWPGQGLSDPISTETNRRHSAGYDVEIKILKEFIEDHVNPQCKGAPLCMLAHSMGGLIGMHLISRSYHDFLCAAFSAPLWGVMAMKSYPAFAATTLLSTMPIMDYAPGQEDWHKGLRDAAPNRVFSKDRKREPVHNQWCLADDRLCMNGITWGWLKETFEATEFLRSKKADYSKVKIPVYVGTAGQDTLVDNKKITAISKKLPNAQHLHFDDSFHEILMERDEIRDPFLNMLYEFIEQNC